MSPAGARLDPRRRGLGLLQPQGRQRPLHRAGLHRQHRERRGGPGRLDHHPAGGQERPRRRRPGLRPQDRRRPSWPSSSRSSYTKDEILEHYLNTVYFGSGAYGVQAAAETYFRKDVADLNWAEGALLGGIIRCPTSCDPHQQPRAGPWPAATPCSTPWSSRAACSRGEADLSKFAPLPEDAVPPAGPGGLLRRGGQAAAARRRAAGGHAHRPVQHGLRRWPADLHHPRPGRCTSRRSSPATRRSRPTRATPPSPSTPTPSPAPPGSAPRPWPGSSPRPVRCGSSSAVPASTATSTTWPWGRTARSGRPSSPSCWPRRSSTATRPTDTVNGSGPCRDIPGYPKDKPPPDNYGGSRGGTRTLTAQTTSSSNCAFLRLNQIVGPQKVADLAARLGITSPLHPENASMPLGTDGVSPLDMASAYSVFANDGVRNAPYFIDRVEDADGNIVFAHQADPERDHPVPGGPAGHQVLERTSQKGTGTRPRSAGRRPGKTGTTNGPTDVWFVGYVPQLSVSVWMGGTADNGAPRRARSPRPPAASTRRPTWGDFMAKATADMPGAATSSPPEPGARRRAPLPAHRRPTLPLTPSRAAGSGDQPAPTRHAATAAPGAPCRPVPHREEPMSRPPIRWSSCWPSRATTPASPSSGPGASTCPSGPRPSRWPPPTAARAQRSRLETELPPPRPRPDPHRRRGGRPAASGRSTPTRPSTAGPSPTPGSSRPSRTRSRPWPAASASWRTRSSR